MPEIKKLNITQTVSQLIADVPAVIRAGNVDEVRRLKIRIENFRKQSAALTKAFDDSLTIAQFGLNGDDFLKGITTIIDRSNRGRKAAIVPEIDPADFF